LSQIAAWKPPLLCWVIKPVVLLADAARPHQALQGLLRLAGREVEEDLDVQWSHAGEIGDVGRDLIGHRDRQRGSSGARHRPGRGER